MNSIQNLFRAPNYSFLRNQITSFKGLDERINLIAVVIFTALCCLIYCSYIFFITNHKDSSPLSTSHEAAHHVEKIPEDQINLSKYNQLVKKRIYASKQSVSWDDLLHLVHSRIALRHTSSIEFAEKEMIEGTKGDALSISEGIASLLYHLFKQNEFGNKQISDFLEEKEVREFEELDNSIFSVNEISSRLYSRYIDKILNQLTASEKKILLDRYEEALRQFIYNSCNGWDNPQPENREKLESWVNDLSRHTNFIIIQKEKKLHRPYDQSYYYNLGKLGRGSIQQQELKEMIYPPSAAEVQTFQEHLPNITMEIVAIEEKVVDRFLRLIMEAAKNYH